MTEKANDDKAHKDALIRYWMEKARESMEAAQSEYNIRGQILNCELRDSFVRVTPDF